MNHTRPRLLIVWHGALFPEYRKPFELLHRANWDVTLLVPQHWRQALTREQSYIPDSRESFRTFVEPVRFSRHAVLHDYPNLTPILQQTSPDILLAIEEPYSLITARLLFWCRKRKIPFLFHSYQDLYKRYPPPFCWTQSYVLRHSNLALVANRTVEQVLRRKGFTHPVILYPYGIDPVQFQPVDRQSSTTIRIGYVGRFVPEKGIDLLISALATRSGNTRLVLVGDGPARDSLQKLSNTLGIANRIEWIGPVPPGQLPNIYRNMDILVLPSRTMPNWQEQFGRVLVEAMACGVPVVGSDCGAIPEVIGDAGLIFPECDREALASCLNHLIDSESLRHQYATRGRERVLQFYTHDQCAQVLDSALRNSSPEDRGRLGRG
ncbi:MAG TPA: glycosyltransferase family 4 protein [bacterium]|nr:glycosyltransferase family 4 protein [bacterium]